MSNDRRIEQLTADRGRAYMNVDHRITGAVSVSGNSYNLPTYLCVNGATYRIIQFSSRLFADNWLADNEARYDKVIDITVNELSERKVMAELNATIGVARTQIPVTNRSLFGEENSKMFGLDPNAVVWPKGKRLRVLSKNSSGGRVTFAVSDDEQSWTLPGRVLAVKLFGSGSGSWRRLAAPIARGRFKRDVTNSDLYPLYYMQDNDFDPDKVIWHMGDCVWVLEEKKRSGSPDTLTVIGNLEAEIEGVKAVKATVLDIVEDYR